MHLKRSIASFTTVGWIEILKFSINVQRVYPRIYYQNSWLKNAFCAIITLSLVKKSLSEIKKEALVSSL